MNFKVNFLKNVLKESIGRLESLFIIIAYALISIFIQIIIPWWQQYTIVSDYVIVFLFSTTIILIVYSAFAPLVYSSGRNFISYFVQPVPRYFVIFSFLIPSTLYALIFSSINISCLLFETKVIYPLYNIYFDQQMFTNQNLITISLFYFFISFVATSLSQNFLLLSKDSHKVAYPLAITIFYIFYLIITMLMINNDYNNVTNKINKIYCVISLPFLSFSFIVGFALSSCIIRKKDYVL